MDINGVGGSSQVVIYLPSQILLTLLGQYQVSSLLSYRYALAGVLLILYKANTDLLSLPTGAELGNRL